MHEYASSSGESTASRAPTLRTTPSLASLESIPDWGSTRDFHMADPGLTTNALESIRAACDAGKGVIDLAARARILDAHMERALIGALQASDAGTVSYLRQQMYYMSDRRRCTDIIAAASRHLPALETKGKAGTVREFIRLLSYGTPAAQREPLMSAIMQRYPADDLVLQLQQAFHDNDAAEVADLRMLMFELSLPLKPQQLKTVAEQLPDAVERGRGAVIAASAPLFQQARGEDWYSSAIMHAADRCLSAPSASLADAIKGFTVLAAGLDQTSLERMLTTLAGALPYEKSEGSLAAVRAFGDALDQHAGRLDTAARARLLAAFETRVKPRKTGSPFRLPAMRKAGSASPEFTEARREVRARLKNPPGNLGRTLRRAFVPAGTGAAPR